MSSLIPELENEGYPEESDITILNTCYAYPKYEDGKKIDNDRLFLVYRDNKLGINKYKIIDKPDYTFYRLKDGVPIPNYNQLFVEKEKVEPVTVPFNKLEANIAHVVGKDEEYKNFVFNRNKEAIRDLHTEPSIFFSDVNIEDHYRFKFANSYKNDIFKLRKAFYDIEVDGKWAKGDFTELGECAINCVSYFDENSDTVYTFILRDERNPLIQEFEDKFNNGIFGWNEIHNFIVDAVGGEEQAEKNLLMKTKFSLIFFDQEIDLIRAFFQTVHKCSPDFVEGWNSSGFDMAYFIARIQMLGYSPEEVMSDPRWKIKYVKHYIDHRNINDPAERGDYTFISGTPVWMDQYIQYASKRKAKMGSYASLKLDDIGELEAHVHKLDYSHITHKVTELPWLDFQTFVLYNIMDTVVQKCIENKTQDLEYIFTKCLVNNTVYRKGHRQTTYLINRMANDWYKMGYIIGNNTNTNNPKPPKFLGALVGKPDNTSDYSKIKINGNIIWLCDNLIDYDFKSLYPSVLGEFNIAPNTLIGKIIIPDKVYENENYYKVEEEKYSRSGEFIENMVVDNHIEFCHRWFKLANFEEMIDDIDEFFDDVGIGRFSNLVNSGYGLYDDGGISPFVPTKSKMIDPILITDQKYISPFTIYKKRDKNINYINLKETENE